MGRESVASGLLAGLGRRLAGLRRAAGLSQAELVRRMDRKARTAQPLVSRLERGKEPNPGLFLILDYLRACRAGPEDIAAVLRGYTSRPIASSERGTEEVARVAAGLPRRLQREVERQDWREVVCRGRSGREPEDVETRVQRARNRAAAVERRARVLATVGRELNAGTIGFEPTWVQRRVLLQHGAKVWSICLRTRRSRPGRREALLAQAPEWLKGYMPAAAVGFVQSLVVELFETMENPERPEPERRR